VLGKTHVFRPGGTTSTKTTHGLVLGFPLFPNYRPLPALILVACFHASVLLSTCRRPLSRDKPTIVRILGFYWFGCTPPMLILVRDRYFDPPWDREFIFTRPLELNGHPALWYCFPSLRRIPLPSIPCHAYSPCVNHLLLSFFGDFLIVFACRFSFFLL